MRTILTENKQIIKSKDSTIPQERVMATEFGTMVKVTGDSMTPAYEDGDVLVIEQASFGKYHRGDAVIALVRGSETVLARYGGQGMRARPKLESGWVRLLKDNSDYQAIELAPGECEVQAVVRSVVPAEEVKSCE